MKYVFEAYWEIYSKFQMYELFITWHPIMGLFLNGITGDIPTNLVPEFTAKLRKRIKRKATLMFTT